ncbi:MAG: hypothetical protein EBY44_09705, partial [Actinobacteria bacterium]|nr:hypothetical protein [Actinomycetota bacterium]
DAREIVDTEVALGRRLIQLGFMRVYDERHTQVADALEHLGAARHIRCVHRNTNDGSRTVPQMLVESIIHDIHTVRWLGDDEIVSVATSVIAGGVDTRMIIATCRLAGGAVAVLELGRLRRPGRGRGRCCVGCRRRRRRRRRPADQTGAVFRRPISHLPRRGFPMTVRFVVLGCGRIGSMHAAYLHRRVAEAEVVGVFDVVAEVAENVGAELGVPVAADLKAALAIDADAVAICTSTDTHVDVMIAAAEAGRAVFCEKPISLDVAEVDRALAAVEAAGVPLHIGFNRRFDPSHKAVADAVADGSIGEVELVNITSRDPAPPPIAYIEVSGGIFNDMAIHDFDMARFVTGSEVESVYALGRVRVDPAIGQAGDVDTAVIVLTHENGCLTTIDISRRAVYGYDQRVEAFGSGGHEGVGGVVVG